jgi:hypothetical protein
MSNMIESYEVKIKCRLCESDAVKKFNTKILNKYNVVYYECSGCRSLQTQNPYWIDESYSELDFNLDTGALQRNMNNFAACYALCKILSVNNIVDFGAKDGLLCRFLRDHQINCFAYDKYSKPSYSIDFQATIDLGPVDMLMAFEVLEHLPNPITDLDEIFSFNPSYVLVSTEIYTGQGEDWWYLAKEGGQHIFFYSVEAINIIAKKYRYSVTKIGNMILFFKSDIENVQNKIISSQTVLNGWIFQAIKSYIFLLPTYGIQADHDLVKSKIAKKDKNN